MAKLGEYEQNNYYCHAPFPGALDSVAYVAPPGSELRAVQIITRNGDRAPCGCVRMTNLRCYTFRFFFFLQDFVVGVRLRPKFHTRGHTMGNSDETHVLLFFAVFFLQFYHYVFCQVVVGGVRLRTKFQTCGHTIGKLGPKVMFYIYFFAVIIVLLLLILSFHFYFFFIWLLLCMYVIFQGSAVREQRHVGLRRARCVRSQRDTNRCEGGGEVLYSMQNSVSELPVAVCCERLNGRLFETRDKLTISCA